jgi:hypothetical protein
MAFVFGKVTAAVASRQIQKKEPGRGVFAVQSGQPLHLEAVRT